MTVISVVLPLHAHRYHSMFFARSWLDTSERVNFEVAGTQGRHSFQERSCKGIAHVLMELLSC